MARTASCKSRESSPGRTKDDERGHRRAGAEQHERDHRQRRARGPAERPTGTAASRGTATRPATAPSTRMLAILDLPRPWSRPAAADRGTRGHHRARTRQAVVPAATRIGPSPTAEPSPLPRSRPAGPPGPDGGSWRNPSGGGNRPRRPPNRSPIRRPRAGAVETLCAEECGCLDRSAVRITITKLRKRARVVLRDVRTRESVVGVSLSSPSDRRPWLSAKSAGDRVGKSRHPAGHPQEHQPCATSSVASSATKPEGDAPVETPVPDQFRHRRTCSRCPRPSG